MSGKCGGVPLTVRLTGKTVLLTGCTSSIGVSILEDFVRRGARVLAVFRNNNEAQMPLWHLRRRTSGTEGLGRVYIVEMDLSSLASVRSCAQMLLETEPQINLLVYNASVMLCPEERTADGFEMQFGTNHLGHFLLTCLLLPRIRASAPARIVTVSSRAYKWVKDIDFNNLNWEKNYNPRLAYGLSKLANVLFTKELAKRLEGSGVNAYSLHPGAAATDRVGDMDDTLVKGNKWIMNNAVNLVIKSPEEGAQTTIYCAVSEEVAEESGYYYCDSKKASLTALAENAELAARLWEESAALVNLGDWDPFTAIETPEDSLTIPAKELLENE